MAGCDRQQISVREAYQIPQPQQTLLQRHGRPGCDFGAPNTLPAKTADTWTPYSGKPETRTEGDTPKPAPAESADHASTYALLAKERDCYRQAEVKVRKKLHRLQSSVGDTVTALQQETRRRAGANARGTQVTQSQ